MSIEAFELAQALLVSLGGGSLIVLALSSWLYPVGLEKSGQVKF